MLPFSLFAQEDGEHCANEILLTITSVNFIQGCDWNDGGGIDPSIYIYDLNGNILIANEVENMSQVSGPGQNVSFDLSSNPNCCGTGYTQLLGIHPIEILDFQFQVEIFESDGGCCEGYNGDDSYGQGIIDMNIVDDAIGTIDVGSNCVSFNYELQVTPIFKFGRTEIEETVCADYSIEINNIEYGIDNPQGMDTIWGGSANGCDSFINVMLDFYDPVSPEITGDPKICFEEVDILTVSEEYESYEWSIGGDNRLLEIASAGEYVVTVTEENGCTAEANFLVEFYDIFFPTIVGLSEFCDGESASLIVDESYQSYAWSTGQQGPEVVVTESGEYTVTVVNDEGCESVGFFTIEELILDEPSILGNPILCYAETAELAVEGEYVSYEWSTGDTGQAITIDGSGQYSVTVTSNIGCQNENTFLVEQLVEYIERDSFYTCDPTLAGNEDMSIISPDGCAGRRIESTILYAEAPKYDFEDYHRIISRTNLTLAINLEEVSENVSIDWFDQNDELICSACNEINVAPTETTIYYAVIKYHPECSIREAIEVSVKSDTRIFVPNIISLSQEGNNEFRIFGLDIASIERFSIYDRWGNLVLEESGIDAFWDGSRSGLELSNGVYVYLIDLTFIDGTTKSLAGDITKID